MKLHKGKTIERSWGTRNTTVCGRMNARCADGMNIADSDAEVTCKFCLAKMPAAASVEG